VIPALITSGCISLGEQDYETSPALSNWDTLLYTRNFSSTNSERAKRHVSKLLTYPMTMASVMHRLGPYAGSRGGLDGRLTVEGSRSMAGESSYGPAPFLSLDSN
jgi:splicing suppressor protein 51